MMWMGANMTFKILWQAMICLVMGMSCALAAPKCPINYGARADAKPNKLYLVFPAAEVPDTVDKSVFPPSGFDPQSTWLPLPRFDASTFTHYYGTSEQLREAIHDRVTDIFCELNVQVITTTAPPPPSTTERRNVVGIGTDLKMGRPCSHERGPVFGESTTAGGDPGDSNPRDFARIFAGSYNCDGKDRSLEQWANFIGGTAAHEAAHNFGLSHQDGHETARPHEDSWPNHLMKEGNDYSYDERANTRHFSDFETSALARNVGLAIDTMWTWSLSNPNEEPATKLHMELLSAEPALILSWAFEGDSSPWIKPTLSGPNGERILKGNTYKVYQIEWSMTNDRWESPGQVPQRKRFQVGATFSSAGKASPVTVIISDVTLLDQNNQTLQKHPHWMGFDAGTPDRNTGDLNVRFFNFLDQPLILRDVMIQDLPRVLSINAMMKDRPLTDIYDNRFTAWTTRRPALQSSISEILKRESMPWDEEGSRRPPLHYTIDPGEEVKVPVANRAQGRHISVQRPDGDCLPASPTGRGLDCHGGITVDDLFPATTMYITATVVDPAGVENRLFYQIAGRRARLP
jgi:hypothetical protein